MGKTPGERIKELRQLGGISQEELGRRIGVQRAAINKYENGTVTNIPIPTVEKLANVFQVSPNYIVGWNEDGRNPLAIEVKILQGITKYYGADAVDLLEDFTTLTKVGRKRLMEYADELTQIYKL